MANFSMLALDVDGTLLNDQHEITALTRQALLQVHSAGVKIVLCTGRGPGNAVPILEQLGLEGVLITHNGAATVQTPGNVLLHECGFSVIEVAALIRYCREKRVHFDVSTTFGMYVNNRLGLAEAEMYKKFMLEPEHVDDLSLLDGKLVKYTLFGTPGQLDEVEREMPHIGLPDSLQYIRSGDFFIDVMSMEASKGKALEQLAVRWNMHPERIMAMGNYYNDLEMIQYAGLGIAMDNSPDAVKAAADAVTGSNNEDGVYTALVRFGLI
ncbi:HAD family hydrolase [Paenibacillus piri]|uniref:HAD family hydrolase n=1 Tax=Paenibacillus piri TaxID=2547395 RepID=A0A4R5KMU5_9BACL|nr:HAD family hydrolase [Paenibacillus piri]TDF95880.1 HAD family hydrolase [Paenibacillus piri]